MHPFSQRFYRCFTLPALCSGAGGAILPFGNAREVSDMEFHWDAAADLEDLIYECKEVSASER